MSSPATVRKLVMFGAEKTSGVPKPVLQFTFSHGHEGARVIVHPGHFGLRLFGSRWFSIYWRAA